MLRVDNNMHSYLLDAGRVELDSFRQKGDLSNQIYAFDNGMIIIGLLNLYNVTKDPNLLFISEHIVKA